LLNIARSPEQLSEMLRHIDGDISEEVEAKRRQAFENHLGPLDGHASERFWEVVDRHVNSRTLGIRQQEHRRQVLARKRYYCAWEMLVAQGRYAFWTIMGRLIGLGGKRLERIRSGLSRMTSLLRDRIRECRTVATGRELETTIIVGHRDMNWRFRVMAYLYRRKQSSGHEGQDLVGGAVPATKNNRTPDFSCCPEISSGRTSRPAAGFQQVSGDRVGRDSGW